jgi:hypothetical protein
VGLGFMVWDSRFKVWALDFGLEGLRFTTYDLRFKV